MLTNTYSSSVSKLQFGLCGYDSQQIKAGLPGQ
jgi:hypothetical protein